MDLRRALMLFAAVLGLAALVSVIVQPKSDSGEETPVEVEPSRARDAGPTARPRPGTASAEAVTLTFGDRARPVTRRLAIGRPATVLVAVRAAGQVEIAGLGLLRSGEPLTPARFDVLAERAGTHEIRFLAAGDSRATTIGTLAIVTGGEPRPERRSSRKG